MRAVIPLLVLLFSLCGAQAASVPTDLDLDLDDLLDSIVLLGLKKAIAELQANVKTMKTESTAQEARLAASEAEVANLKTVNAAQETKLAAGEAEVANLKAVNADQEARLAAGEAEVVDLKAVNAAQNAELTALKNRLANTETGVANLEKANAEQPKVAFSAGVTGIGYVKAEHTEMDVVFDKVITNVGEAYNATSGCFTAPIKGVYYFRFTVMDFLESHWMTIMMFKNKERVIHLYDFDTDGFDNFLSSGVTLQLEAGDVVNMRLPLGSRIWDREENRSTFSGFLLFPL